MPPAVARETRGEQERFEEESGVRAGKEKVVAQVVKVADPSAVGGMVADPRGQVDWRDATPIEPHGKLGVEVEPPPAPDRTQCFQSRADGVNAQSEKGVMDATPPGLEVGKPIADPTTDHPHGRSVRTKHGTSKNHGFRVQAGCLHKAG